MGCGCEKRAIDYASTDEYLQKIRKIAKNMAMDEGVWYVIIRRGDGSVTYLREVDTVASAPLSDQRAPVIERSRNDQLEIVEYVSPL